MVATIKHKFTNLIPDEADTSIVRPSDWNDTHDLTGTIPLANGGTNADLSATGPGFLKQASIGAGVTIALPTATDVGLGNVDNTSDTSKTATLVAATHTWALTQTFTLAPVYTDAAGTRTALGLAAVAASGSASDLGSGTLPNGRLVAVPNSALANSAITFNGTSVSLGGSISKGWITLKQANVEQTVVTGVTTKQNSFALVIPGGTLGLNGRLRITPIWRFTGANGTRTVTLDFGGTSFWTPPAFLSAVLSEVPLPLIIANRNSLSSQILVNSPALSTAIGSQAPDVFTAAINTAVDQTLALTVTLANGSDTGAIESAMVEYNNDNP